MDITKINEICKFTSNIIISKLDNPKKIFEKCDDIFVREDKSRIVALNEDDYIFYNEGFYELNKDNSIGKCIAHYSW